jgi:hypothetical protein
VDRDQAAVLGARRIADLELARQLLVDGVAQEVAHRRLGVRRHVEHAVLSDAAEGIRSDVADGVPAGLARGDAGLGEAAHHFRRVFEHDEVELDRLPGRHVAELARGVHLGAVGDGVELAGRERAVGHLDAHHLPVGLALAVGAVLEAERAEVVAEAAACAPGERFALEVIDFGLDDGVVGLVLGELGTRALRDNEAPPGQLLP